MTDNKCIKMFDLYGNYLLHFGGSDLYGNYSLQFGDLSNDQLQDPQGITAHREKVQRV